MEEKEMLNGWIKLYHPGSGGVQCTLPVPAARLSAEQANGLFQSVQSLLDAGFQINQTGLTEGEIRETVTHLARRVKTNPDGSHTNILDVYCGGNWKLLHLYLNNPQDIDRFTEVFGLVLSDLPLWEGEVSIERGKNPERDTHYILAVKGVDVVFKANPKWEGEDDKKHPKRVFVRWEPHTDHPAQDSVAPGALRIYLDGSRVNGNVTEQQSFDRYLEIHETQPASREALRSWVRENPPLPA